MKKRKKRVIGCSVLSAFIAIPLAVVVYFWADFPIAAMQFGAAEERARKAGVPLTLQDLGIDPPPEPMPDGVPLEQSIYSEHGPAFDEAASEMHEALADPARGPAEALRIAEALSSQAEEVYRASKLPYRQVDYDLGFALVVSGFGDQRSVAKLFSYRASAHAQMGQIEAAARDLATIRRIAVHADEPRLVISALVAIAVEAMAMGGTRAAAEALARDPEGLAILEREVLAAGEMRMDLEEIMRREAYFSIASIRNLDVQTGLHPLAAILVTRYQYANPDWQILGWNPSTSLIQEPPPLSLDTSQVRRSGPPPGWLMRGSMTRSLEAWAAYFEAIPESGATVEHQEEGLRRMEDILDNRRLSYVMAQETAPLPVSIPIISHGTRADHLMTQAYVDVLQFRNQRGRWPESLAEAGVQAMDPYDGKPLRYRLEGEGFRIWSVGFNGRDDGGTFPFDRNATYPVGRRERPPNPSQP